jgi:hypothetical protein
MLGFLTCGRAFVRIYPLLEVFESAWIFGCVNFKALLYFSVFGEGEYKM